MPSAPASTISFARGAPSLDIVDVEGLRDAAVRAFESDPAGTTAYGTSIGYPRLRSWIAEHHGVEPERVLVTNGSMQADAFLFEHLVRSGDEVIVERPTYDRTLLSLRERGARIHAVELQPDGIDVDALEQLLSPAGGVRPTLAHIIPNFQNPAGYTLSVEKRTAPAAARGRPRLPGVRGRPLRGAALRRGLPADDALAEPRARRVRLVVLEDRLPGNPGGLPRRPRRN